jgi:anti-anti-sigma factor
MRYNDKQKRGLTPHQGSEQVSHNVNREWKIMTQRIEVKKVADVTIATTLDMKLNDDLSIQEWGEQLIVLFDDVACKKLLVSFERVLFMSSSALRALITLNKKAKEVKASLVLSGIDDNIMEAFRITRLDSVFQIKKNEDEGIGAFDK